MASSAERTPASAPRAGPIGRLTVDRLATILRADDGAARLLGRGRRRIAGVPLDSLVAGPGRKRVRAFLARIARTLAPATLRVDLPADRRGAAPVLLVGSAGRPAAGEIVVVVVPLSRALVTAPPPGERENELQALAEQVRESEERFRLLGQAVQQTVWRADASGALDYASSVSLDLPGRPSAAVDGWKWTEFVHPDDLDATLASWRHALATGETHVFEHRLRRADGEFRWHLTRGLAVRDESGRPVRWIGCSTDIHDVKEAGARLRESETLLRAVSDGTVDPIFVKDLDGRFLFVNPALLEALGRSAEEVVGRTLEEMHASPEFAREIRRSDERAIEERRLLTVEETVETATGRRVYLTARTPRFDAAGNVIGLVCVARDITDRKRAEEAVERARVEAENERNRLEAVLEALPVGVAILDACGGSVASNPTFEAIWGAGRPLVDGIDGYSSYRAWWPDSERPVAPEEWASARAVREGETVVGQLMRIERFDGSTAFVHNSAAPIRDAGGRITGSAVALMDVTKSVEAERALRDIKRDWERTFDSVPDLIAVLDREHRVVRANRAMAGHLARTRDQLLGQQCFRCVHDASRPVGDCPHGRTLQDGCEHVAELCESGLGGAFEVSTTPLLDDRGRVTGSVHVARDVTETKRKEAALLRLNRTLEAISRSSQAMLRATSEEEYLEDVCRIVVEVCGHAQAWVGLGAGSEGGALRRAAGFGSEDDLAASITMPLVDAGRAFGALHISSRLTDAFSPDDVTLLERLANDLAFGIGARRLREAREEAAASLLRSEGRYRTLVESSPEAIYVCRGDGIVYANPAAVALLGAADEGQLLGRSPGSLFDGVDPKLAGGGGAPVQRGPGAPPARLRVVRLDGTVRYVESVATAFEDAAGAGEQVILRDVTAHMQAEARLLAALDETRRREAEMAALLRAARTVLECRAFEEAARAILGECLAIVGARQGTIALASPEGWRGSVTIPGSGDEEWWPREDDGSPLAELRARAFATGRTVLGSSPATPAGPPCPALVSPLVVGGEPAGFLALAGGARDFSEGDARLAAAFAEMTAVALLNSRTRDLLESQVKERTRELERANHSLSAERRRLFALLDELPLYVFLRAPDHSIVFANRYLREHSGEPTGKSCFDVMGAEGLPCASCRADEVLETSCPARWEWSTPGGRSFQIDSFPFVDSDGARLILELGVDITALTRSYEAEQKARKTADALRESSLALTRSLDLDTVLTTLLRHVARLVPHERAKVMLLERSGRLSPRFLVEGDAVRSLPRDEETHFSPRESPVVQRVLRSPGAVVVPDVRAHRGWGHRIPEGVDRSWMGVPLIARGRPVGMFSLSRREPGGFDAEHVKSAEALSAQASVAIENALLFDETREARERMQTLSHRLVEAQEDERRAIARELHDEAGQALTSLLFGLRLLERDDARLEGSRTGIPALTRTAEEVLENLHRLAANLRPASLDHLGLEAALRQHVAGIERSTGLVIRLSVRGLDQGRLPSSVETALYRVVQEALTNVARHANATSVDVLAERRKERVVVMVEDDGRGFAPEAARGPDRLGLVGMRERVESLGGSFHVETARGAGTTVVVEVPCGDPSPDRR